VAEHAEIRRPIACSLTADELVDRTKAWRKLFRDSLVAADRAPGGMRLSVHPGAGAALRELVELECECCPWIDFALEGCTVTMTAEGDAESILLEQFHFTDLQRLVADPSS
jgi:hypothetical protein